MALSLISKPKPTTGPAARVPQSVPVRVQTKLKVREPNDRFEEEADRVADAVVNTPGSALTGFAARSVDIPSSLQRMCAECSEEDEEIQRKPLAGLPRGPRISKLNAPAAARLAVEPAALDGDGADIAPHLEQSIRQSRGGGSPLPDAVRGFLEPRFGRDLTGVRIHTDRSSGELADQLQSRAFTVGSDIFFAPGEYQPRSASGLRILSHEVTHAVQQGAVSSAGLSGAAPGGTGAVQREVNPKRIESAATVLAKIKRLADSYGDLGKTMGPAVANMARMGKLGIGFSPGATKEEKENAFVYTCRCGWIDMGHFFISAAAAYGVAFLRQFESLKPGTVPLWGVKITQFPEKLLGAGLRHLRPVLEVLLGTVAAGDQGEKILADARKLLETGTPAAIGLEFGYWMEFLQQGLKLKADPMKTPPEWLVGAQRSAFTMEDLPSDCYGSVLGQQLWDRVALAAGDSSPVYGMMEKFFAECEPVYPTGRTRCEMMAETTPGSCHMEGSRDVWPEHLGQPARYTSTKPNLLKSAEPLCGKAAPRLCELGGGGAEKATEAPAEKAPEGELDRFLLFRGFRLSTGSLTRYGPGLALPSSLHIDNFLMSPAEELPTGAVDLSFKRRSAAITLLEDIKIPYEHKVRGEFGGQPGIYGRPERIEAKAPYVLRGPTILGLDARGNFFGTSTLHGVQGLGDTKVLVRGNLATGRIRGQAEGVLGADVRGSVKIDFGRLLKGLAGPEAELLRKIFKSDDFMALVKQLVAGDKDTGEFLRDVRSLLKADFPQGVQGFIDTVMFRLKDQLALATSLSGVGVVRILDVPTSLVLLQKSPGMRPLLAAEAGLVTSELAKGRVLLGGKGWLYGERFLQAQLAAGVDPFAKKASVRLHAESGIWTGHELSLDVRYERSLAGTEEGSFKLGVTF